MELEKIDTSIGSGMSGPVDVLRAMDRARDYLIHDLRIRPSDELEKARSAVAELILAAGDVDKAFMQAAEHPFLLRVRAALARVKGESR